MNNEKFTDRDLEKACEDLALLRYWTPDMPAPVMHFLAQICPHRQALQWLVAELVNRIGYWPGSAEVRGLLCTRYNAADGIDQWCSLPGYRAEDCEARYLERHEQRKAQEKAGGYVGDEVQRKIREIAERKKLPPGKEPGSSSGGSQAVN
jgi:hypothetical protein